MRSTSSFARGSTASVNIFSREFLVVSGAQSLLKMCCKTYDWPFTPGSHTFEVRCYEGDGTPQIAEQRPARPSGSTGIHSEQVTL